MNKLQTGFVLPKELKSANSFIYRVKYIYKFLLYLSVSLKGYINLTSDGRGGGVESTHFFKKVRKVNFCEFFSYGTI